MKNTLNTGSVVCFLEGRGNVPVAYDRGGKAILCRHEIPLGYAEICSVQDRGRYYLVAASHAARDVYSGIDYNDFMDVLPLHGFKVGFDRIFINPRWNNEEHQIYAYNLKNNVVIVAETFTEEGEGRIGFNSINVYCPQFPEEAFKDCDCITFRGHGMTCFNLAASSRGRDLLSRINSIMETCESTEWPENRQPFMWTYADRQTDENGERILDDRTIARLLEAPESLQIFKGCRFLQKIS